MQTSLKTNQTLLSIFDLVFISISAY